MKYYFKKFAKQKIQSEPNAFVWLLYFAYCSLIDVEKSGGEVWEHLKIRIKEFNFNKKTIDKIKKSASFLLRNLGTNTNNAISSSPVSKIKSLQVKNFRGFGSDFNGEDKGVLIEFDFNNTIFYGPNGCGKSSLCDALEYKLTGQVREALRRNRRVYEFVKRIGSSSNPSLSISFVDSAMDGEKLTEDEKKYYSQAFIEKNRIQEFSLFGSKDTGIRKEQILSILIGMDDLSDLANSFVQPPAFRLNLLSFKRSVVANKIITLNIANVSNTTLQKSHEDAIAVESVKADTILSKTATTIPDLEAELGRIKKEIDLLNADTLSLSSNAVSPQTQKEFEDSIQSVENSLLKYDALSDKLVAAKTDLSFSNLYTAIGELHAVVTDICPACDTPLSSVARNPFTKASEELVKLKGIKELEEEFETHKKVVEEYLKSLELLHKNLLSNTTSAASLKSLIPDGTVLNSKLPQYSLESRNVIDENIKAIKKEILTLGNYFAEVDSIHQKQTQKQAIVRSNNEKVSALNERRNSVEAIKNNWQSTQTKLDAVNVSLGTYTTELGKLNTEKIKEDNYNNFIDSLIEIYPLFYSELQSFKDKEFQTRFGKLETEIAAFYTQINKHDSENETIEFFKINTSDSDYKIEFQIKGYTITEDASIKFSEGHLRSLGLSILLANAKINSLPFIIFDDVVNAIDSDHRANIIEMMVNDSYLKDVQQIVSTHDRLYWERFSIENQNKKFSSYVLKCTKQGVVHYHYNLSFKKKIQNALDHFDIRQALLYSRIWFETLAKQFCMEHKIELKGTLKSNELHISIEPSLGSIYRELSKALPENEHLKILHQDDINYKGINQEHHSFDEYNFNFIHSRTSHEVQKIFDAVIGLDEDIRFLKSHITILNNLIQFYKKGCERIKTLNLNMPLNVQQGIIDNHSDAINQLKDFPEQMAKLKISESEIKEAEEKINKVLIGMLLSSLFTHSK